MPIRIQQYNTQPRRIQAGGVDPGFAQPLIRDAGRSAQADVVNDMLSAGMQITEVGIREYVKDQSTAVAAALNDYRRQLSEERERYTTENRGRDAVGAGEHFGAFAREAAAPLAEKFSGRFREMFLRDAAATGLHFTEQGQAYGRREKEAWEKSVLEGDMSQTLDAIANDPGNAEFVQQSLAELKQRMVAMTPGLDHRAMEADLNRKVAGVTIDALLARDNVGGAQGALAQYRELLGAAAPQYEARIRAAGNRRRAELRAGVGSRLEDGFAALEDGKNAPDLPSNQEIYAAYGDNAPEVIRRKDEMVAFSANLQNIRRMTREQQMELLKREEPQSGEGYRMQAALHAKLERAVAEDARRRETDPAAYLANVDVDVARTRDAMFRNFTPESANAYLTALAAAKDERGMTGAMVLPREDARQLADRLQSGDNPVGAIRTMHQAFGRQWPEVMRQIAPDMGNQMNLIASGMGERAGKLLIEAGRDKDFPRQAESLLALNGSDKTEYRNSIRDAMQPFNATLLAGQDSAMAAAVNDAVDKLGLKYMLEGMNKDDAIKKAAEEVVLDRYNLVESGGHAFRVPKMFDASEMYAGAKNALAKVSENPGDIGKIPYKGMGEKQQDASYASMISNNGYWVTNRDESGVLLYVGGMPVLDRNGAPVSRTWAQLQEAGAAAKQMEEKALNAAANPWGGQF